MKLYPLNILKKTIRTKVLIKAMGARRDGGYCLLLKAILEEYGFKVLFHVQEIWILLLNFGDLIL